MPDGELGCLEHLDDEYRMVCGQRAAALGYDVGMGRLFFSHTSTSADTESLTYSWIGVVHRVLARTGTGAVVVDAQSAPYVDKLDVESHLAELGIELHRLAQRIFYAADFCDLAADVEMDELQPFLHLVLLQERQRLKEFAGIESEFADIAAALFPFA